MIVRPATPRDVPAITRLINVAFQVERFFITGARTTEEECGPHSERRDLPTRVTTPWQGRSPGVSVDRAGQSCDGSGPQSREGRPVPSSARSPSDNSSAWGTIPRAPSIPTMPGRLSESARPEGTTISDPRFTMLS